MGTRSLTRVFGGDEPLELLCTIYKQYDGYPSGLGLELAEWLKDLKIVNGFSTLEKQRVANGPGCLAMQLIHFLKGDKEGPQVGGTYLYPNTIKAADCNAEWEYHIVVPFDGDRAQLVIFVTGRSEEIWRGAPKDFTEAVARELEAKY